MFNFFKKKNDNKKLVAYAKGKFIPITDVPDPIFSEKMMGDGVAILVKGDTIYAPCDGTIILVANTLHAVGISSATGVEILIHIGFDTVNLNGKGFTKLINQGDKVKKGTPLIKIDRKIMEEEKIDLTTPMVVTNSADYNISIINEEKDVTTDEEVISCAKK